MDSVTLQLKNINKTTDLSIEQIVIDKYEDIFTFNYNIEDHTLTVETNATAEQIRDANNTDWIFKLRIANKTLINMRDIEIHFYIVIPTVMNVQNENKT